MKSFKKSTMLLLSEKSVHNYHLIKEIFIFTTIVFLLSILLILIPLLITVIVDLRVMSDYPYTQWCNIISSFSHVLMVIIPIIYCTKFEKRSLQSMGFFKKGMINEYIRGYALGVLMSSVYLVISILLGVYSVESMFPKISFGFIFLFFLSFLVQGMAEEVLFRGYLMNTLTKRYSIIFAIIINSVVFGMLHISIDGLFDLEQINHILFGIFVSVYMLRRGSIIGVCAFHSAWNFVSTNILSKSIGIETVFYLDTQNANMLISGSNLWLDENVIKMFVLLIGIFICFKMPQRDPAIDESGS